MAHVAMLRQRHVRAAQAVDLGVFYSTLSAGMILARRYLTGRGIDQDFADRYGSAFGRTAAKAYRAAHGAEPRRAWSLVSGKWRRVNGYLPADVEVLDEAYEAYPRTRDYVTESASESCRIPGCDGTWHYDDTCVAPLGEVAFDGDSALPVELVDSPLAGRHIVAFAYDMASLNLRREMRDQAEAADFVRQMRAVADAVESATQHLPAA